MKNKIQHFMIDPPWPLKEFGMQKFNGGKVKYQTISVEDIFDLLDREVFTLAAKRHHCYIWTIDKYLIDTDIEMEKRGYKRHVRVVWDKLKGMGAPALMLRMSHEYLVWYYKSSLIISNRKLQNCTVLRESSREHSRKPDSAYSLIERLYPNQSYMDVFSRQPREGWHQFGNEKDYFPGYERLVKI